MAAFASRTDIHKLVNMAEKGKKTVASIKEKAAETMGVAVGVLEVSAASFGFGYARGRYATTGGEFAIMGVPPDLLAGVVLHGLGFLGAFGAKYDEHAHNLGNGALAAFLTTKGVQFGVEARSTDPTSKYGPLTKPVVGADMNFPAIGAGGMRMSDQDLAREIARATS
jgi:hypothetical protein